MGLIDVHIPLRRTFSFNRKVTTQTIQPTSQAYP